MRHEHQRKLSVAKSLILPHEVNLNASDAFEAADKNAHFHFRLSPLKSFIVVVVWHLVLYELEKESDVLMFRHNHSKGVPEVRKIPRITLLRAQFELLSVNNSELL